MSESGESTSVSDLDTLKHLHMIPRRPVVPISLLSNMCKRGCKSSQGLDKLWYTVLRTIATGVAWLPVVVIATLKISAGEFPCVFTMCQYCCGMLQDAMTP